MPPTSPLSGFSILLCGSSFNQRIAKLLLLFEFHLESPDAPAASEGFFLSPTIIKIVVLQTIFVRYRALPRGARAKGPHPGGPSTRAEFANAMRSPKNAPLVRLRLKETCFFHARAG